MNPFQGWEATQKLVDFKARFFPSEPCLYAVADLQCVASEKKTKSFSSNKTVNYFQSNWK